MDINSSLNVNDELLVLAPENFSMVEPGVYRSAFPRNKNQAFLTRLGIKTIIPLVPEEYPTAMLEFCHRNDISVLKVGVDGNKWPFKEIDMDIFEHALAIIMCLQEKQNETTSSGISKYKYRPCLIHCNKGKHRTGSLVGCLRKLQNWGMAPIVSEYNSYAAPKPRLEDQRFIEAFDEVVFKEYSNEKLMEMCKNVADCTEDLKEKEKSDVT